MKILSIFLLFVNIVSLAGCYNPIKGRAEVDEITFVKVVGIDKVPNTNQVNVTVTSKASKEFKQKTAEKKESILSANGDTIFDAVRNLNQYSQKKPFWGHCEFILIGEETAKEGVLKYLDFFSREYQFRLNYRAIIVIGETAENVIRSAATEEDFLSDRLSYLINNIPGVSISDDIQIYKLLQMFDRPYSCAYIPCISVEKASEKEDKEDGTANISMNGFSIFKKNKMIAYLKDAKAKGLNWVQGNYKSGIFVVRDNIGGKVSLEVLEEKTKTTPIIDSKGNLSVNIEIKVKSNIGEMYSSSNIFNEKTYRFMEEQQNNMIKSQVDSIIEFAKKNSADFLNIGNEVYHKYPKEWKSIRDNWDKIFAGIPINVEVQSKIRRSYIINQPAGAMEVD